MIAIDAYHIEQNIPNAHTYDDQQEDGIAFKYGYQVVNINNQFQHKQKGPDDVTYGCYGHIDPEGRKQLTFFVADRLGYRVVLTGQPTTVYPLTSVEVSGVSGGRLIQWNDLPFPTACQEGELSGSSSAPRRADLQSPQYDEAYGAESRNTLVTEIRNPNDGAVGSSSPFAEQRPPVDSQASSNLGQTEDLWQQGGSNNDAAINAQASTNVANQSPANKGQTAEQSAVSESWQPFLGTSNSFMLSSQCDRDQTLTLYIPFRLACSDMKEFEAELAKLTARFNRDKC
ncbi:AGAP011505-PA-like protein [Anopheles sinensis]|uniref:AGAP011505-PA-like protein n=1 Tax=Anopheles sinensis TaxID=74873 RepID=A0A084VSA8_ANOSI|nr:AGAP011505-PA-like protein [Anopheles sinensis]